MDKHTPILVIGAGSIGERHIRNLQHLGFTQIHVLRSRQLPMRTVDASTVTIINDPDAIAENFYAFAIICTPTMLHAQQTLSCLERGMHVLVEKPLSHTTEDLIKLQHIAEQRNLRVQVAYMMRYHPHLQAVEALIATGTMGKLLHIATHWGSYMPDWHPWEDHRNSYAARRDMGGGVALTLSHDLDVAHWLANSEMAHYSKQYGYPPHLEIDAEGIADFQITYKNGIIAHVHLNYVERPQRRDYRFIFEEGVVMIDFFAGAMSISSASGVRTQTLPHFDRNDLFIAEISDFIDHIDHDSDHTSFTREQISASARIINMCL